MEEEEARKQIISEEAIKMFHDIYFPKDADPTVLVSASDNDIVKDIAWFIYSYMTAFSRSAEESKLAFEAVLKKYEKSHEGLMGIFRKHLEEI